MSRPSRSWTTQSFCRTGDSLWNSRIRERIAPVGHVGDVALPYLTWPGGGNVEIRKAGTEEGMVEPLMDADGR